MSHGIVLACFAEPRLPATSQGRAAEVGAAGQILKLLANFNSRTWTL